MGWYSLSTQQEAEGKLSRSSTHRASRFHCLVPMQSNGCMRTACSYCTNNGEQHGLTEPPAWGSGVGSGFWRRTGKEFKKRIGMIKKRQPGKILLMYELHVTSITESSKHPINLNHVENVFPLSHRSATVKSHTRRRKSRKPRLILNLSFDF